MRRWPAAEEHIGLDRALQVTQAAGRSRQFVAGQPTQAVYPRHGGARAITDLMVAQAVAKPSKAPPLTFPGEVVHQRMPSAPYTTWDELLDAAGWNDHQPPPG